MIVRRGDRLNSTCPKYWAGARCDLMARSMSEEEQNTPDYRVRHSLTAALSLAGQLNRRAKNKVHKVIIDKGHFVVVDHTWERNT